MLTSPNSDKTKLKRIENLKKQLRLVYLKHRGAHKGLDCGTNLAQHLRPEISKLAIEFNTIAAELETLDETFPKGSRLVVTND